MTDPPFGFNPPSDPGDRGKPAAGGPPGPRGGPAPRAGDLWREDVTSSPTGIRSVQAWSQSEWVEATMPVWSKLCDPIAERAVDAMGGMLTEDPGEIGGVAPAPP